MLDIHSIATNNSYEYIFYSIHSLVMLIMAEWNEACSRNGDICYLVYGLPYFMAPHCIAFIALAYGVCHRF